MTHTHIYAYTVLLDEYVYMELSMLCFQCAYEKQ